MRIYGVWMSYEPGIIGIYADKADAEAEVKKYLMRVYGDLEFLPDVHYDEFDMIIEHEENLS
jgi:hypothetical protein